MLKRRPDSVGLRHLGGRQREKREGSGCEKSACLGNLKEDEKDGEAKGNRRHRRPSTEEYQGGKQKC